MESVEDLVTGLRALTPDQFEHVAQIVHELSGGSQAPTGHAERVVVGKPSVVSPVVLEQAARNGWPMGLLTEVIGQVGDDFHRHPEPRYEVRQAL